MEFKVSEIDVAFAKKILLAFQKNISQILRVDLKNLFWIERRHM